MGSPWPGNVRFSDFEPREPSRGCHRTPRSSAPAPSCPAAIGNIKAVLYERNGRAAWHPGTANSSARPPGRRSVAWSDELRDDRRRRRPDWGPHVNKRRMGKAKMKRPLSIKRRKQIRRRPPQYVAATASGATVEPPPFIAGADRSFPPLPLTTAPPESTPAPGLVQVASEPSASTVFSEATSTIAATMGGEGTTRAEAEIIPGPLALYQEMLRRLDSVEEALAALRSRS
jgi:hypothetical protein